MKKSPLQKATIQKIDNFGGLEKISLFLDSFRLKLNINDNLLLSNLNDYLKFCYKQYVNIEIDILNFRVVFEATIELLRKCIVAYKSDCLIFLHNTLKYNYNYVLNLSEAIN